MKKNSLIFLASFIAVIICLIASQEILGDMIGKKIFFNLKDITPEINFDAHIQDVRALIEGLFEGKKKTDNVQKKIDPSLYLLAGKNDVRLSHFFIKLQQLKEGKRDTVRIMHYGDSLIWGDNCTSLMKKQFQQDFGDGGRGIVPAVHIPSTVLKDHINRSFIDQFKVFHLSHKYVLEIFRPFPAVNPDLGFTAESSLPLYPGSTILLETPEGFAGWKKIQIYLRSQSSPFPVEIPYQVNLQYNGKIESRTIKLPPDTCTTLNYETQPVNSISIDFNGSQVSLPYVDGINLETGKGVAYSTFTRMGTHMSWLNAIPDNHFIQNIRAASPDLLILHYGNNEAVSLEAVTHFSSLLLNQQLRAWVTKIRAVLPDTDILLIGPGECMRTIKGQLQILNQSFEVMALQKSLADEFGFSYFDTYEYLGGKGQMMRLVNQRLATTDYMHLTVPGGDMLAKGVYTVIYNAYKRYIGDTGGMRQLETISSEEKVEFKQPMQFFSKNYGIFLAIVLIVCSLLTRQPRLRILFLSLASCYFYITWAVWPVFLLLATVVVDFTLGKYIYAERMKGKTGTQFLIISIIYNIGTLWIFKYLDFMTDLANSISASLGHGLSLPMMNLILPIGISFYTLKSLTYTIDIWRGNMEAETKISNYAIFISFFPQLLSGPISKSVHFLKGMEARYRRFVQINTFYPKLAKKYWSGAVFLILTGLFKKFGADWLAVNLIDRVFGAPAMFSSVEILVAFLGFTMQIYGDFSGYTDIALGSAALLGFKLPINFNRPFTAISMTDFWRRWHITMGSWFREYLYISLGGNKKRVYLNLFITMFLCGLWHGAGVNYALWGAYMGFFLLLERALKIDKRTPRNALEKSLRTILTIIIISCSFLVFKNPTWSSSVIMMKAIATLTTQITNVNVPIIGVIALFYFLHFSPLTWKSRLMSTWAKMPAALQGATAGVLMIFLYNIAIADIKPFIYFRY